MKKLQFCLVFLFLLLLALSAAAQVQNGTFTGTVTDPSGATIPNAKVTVTNLATNLSVTTTTNSDGVYSARDLPVGTYKITAEAKGFKTISNSGISLNAGTIARIDLKLQLGEAREVVEVTGEAPAVTTEDSRLSTTINSAQISNLPLNGRNVYDLMQAAPGAVDVEGVLTENGHRTVVNGLRENFNGFLVGLAILRSEYLCRAPDLSGYGGGAWDGASTMGAATRPWPTAQAAICARDPKCSL